MIPNRVYLLLISGELADAKQFIAQHYPGRESVVLSKRELREGGWRGQIKAFRKMSGEAMVFFRQSLSELQEPQLAAWSSVFHRCRFTVLADSSGQVVAWSRLTLLLDLPRALASGLCDLFVFLASWVLLQLLRDGVRPVPASPRENVDLDLAYLYPFPLDISVVGGALSHVRGFLSGAISAGARAEIFSGRSLPLGDLRVHLVPAERRLFLFHESRILSYNVRFALAVRKLLQGRRVGSLYQRHGRFLVAGALLSGLCGIPLILEYNGSERWVADHWDPARFRSWLALCEEVSLSRAHLIVVVSEPLRLDLLRQGIPEERILLNPNAVNASAFRPRCGGEHVRNQMGLTTSDIVIGFVGTFHYWHGIKVLEQAIQRLLQSTTDDAILDKLRFVLVGDGLLRAEMRSNLEPFVGKNVFFTGSVPHSRIAAYLDAADILVSPHVPMPDGQPFFGSPTKIFEYMAMGKGIIASNLDQISHVLKHEKSAWLVEPGDVVELTSAIVLLARDPDLRNRLGQNARASALSEHTWEQNAERVLGRIQMPIAGEASGNAIRTEIA